MRTKPPWWQQIWRSFAEAIRWIWRDIFSGFSKRHPPVVKIFGVSMNKIPGVLQTQKQSPKSRPLFLSGGGKSTNWGIFFLQVTMTSHLLIFFTLLRIGRVQCFRYLTCEVHLISSMRLKIDRGHLKVPRKVVPSRGARFAKGQVFSRGELGEDVDDDHDDHGGGDGVRRKYLRRFYL